MKKFKGDITEGSISTAASVKLEPAFLAENEEALLAAGYYKQGQGKRSVRTGRGGYSRGGGQRGQGQEARRKMNPTGPDGKPLTCRVCGSYRHLMKDCPDSWENIKKVNIVEDENVVLFTGYNKEEIYQLGVDARNCAILDSACSSTVYGLKDGARQFYESVREELMKLGFTQCRLDPALFYVHKDNRLRGIICCHVDDFLHAGDELFEALMEKLRGRFSAGKVEEKEFRYIGFKVKQYENRVILDHSEYIERMKNETVDPKRATDKKEILTTQEQKLYRQLVGQLNWAVQGSRPDMAFEMINMSTKLKQGTVENLVRVIKKISRMKDFHSYMTFPRLNKAAELKIVVFTDASLGNINEGTGSTGAYIVWLMDNTGQCCPIAWNAHKIKRVVRSTLAAETLGLEEGLEASYYYREMLASILGVKPRTVMIEAYVDNKSIIEAILSTRLVEDKRLRVDVAAIKESLQLHDVKKIQWVPGHLQLANPMTKQGASGFNLLKVLQSGKMLDELC